VLGRDADAAVDDLDRDARPAPARADDDAAAARVAQRVRGEVAQHALEELRVRLDGEPRRDEAQREAARGRLDAELARELVEQRRERHALAARVERARPRARQVDQLRELRLEPAERAAHARDQRPKLVVAHALRERGDEQPERVQRLAQVVARGGEQLALAAVRGLGGGPRLDRGARARLELGDEVGVAVARGERVGQHVVEPVPEREHEAQHDGHHDRGVQVHRAALAPTRAISGTSAGSTKP
jgi:hypothetical protein